MALIREIPHIGTLFKIDGQPFTDYTRSEAVINLNQEPKIGAKVEIYLTSKESIAGHFRL